MAYLVSRDGPFFVDFWQEPAMHGEALPQFHPQDPYNALQQPFPGQASLLQGLV